MRIIHQPGCPSPWMCMCHPTVIEDAPVLHDAHVAEWERHMEWRDQNAADERYDDGLWPWESEYLRDNGQYT